MLFLLSVPLFAQGLSPYTRIGIGDLEYYNTARMLGMGQLGTSLAFKHSLSIINPAGWYRLNTTRLETGVDYNGNFISDNSGSGYYGDARFSGFTFSFPVSTTYGVGVAMGIVPYSRVNYDLSQTPIEFSQSSDMYTISYKGTGGLSKTFIGSSYKLPFDLVIGATLDYYFGDFNFTSVVTPSNPNDISTTFERTYRSGGLGSTFGIISPDIAPLFSSDKIADFRVGLSVNYISNLKTDTLLTSSSSVRTDTMASGSVLMKIPPRISAGFSFVFNQNYLLSFDIASQAWKNFAFNGAETGNLRNASKISAGLEYEPTRGVGSSFWEQIVWRAGLSYDQTQYVINGSGINQFSVAGGFSLPLSYANTLDIGLQYSMRGSSDFGVVKEHTIKLDLGLSLGEIWFIRTER